LQTGGAESGNPVSQPGKLHCFSRGLRLSRTHHTAQIKRCYWVIESRLHHALDVTLGEDHSRVHNSKPAFALSMFRRAAVSLVQAMAALIACTRSSFANPPFRGAYQNEKVRPSGAVVECERP
jgi:hypothetical protein